MGCDKKGLGVLKEKKKQTNKWCKNNSMKHVGNDINRLFSFSNLDFGHCISITEHLTLIMKDAVLEPNVCVVLL